MPAVSSSPIGAALEQLSRLLAGDRALLSGRCPGLAGYLERVPDPRDRRGVRHGLAWLLMAAVAAVLAGARSFTAVGGWVADAPPQVLAAVGVRCDRPAQPGHRHRDSGRAHQHRRRRPAPRPGLHPDPGNPRPVPCPA